MAVISPWNRQTYRVRQDWLAEASSAGPADTGSAAGAVAVVFIASILAGKWKSIAILLTVSSASVMPD
uniref:Uncharacterized protein n=1 Tax=Geobacter metallireducens TaxID=28232 RepID=A0A831U228_GEOME